MVVLKSRVKYGEVQSNSVSGCLSTSDEDLIAMPDALDLIRSLKYKFSLSC